MVARWEAELVRRLPAATPREPLSEKAIERIAERVGYPIPEPLRTLWAIFGLPGLGGRAELWDPPMLVDHASTYAENGLRGLLPFASESGARDFAVDVLGVLGDVDAIYLIDRTCLEPGYAVRSATDFLAFLDAVAAGKLDLEAPDLAARWTEAESERAFANLPASLRGLTSADAAIRKLHFRTHVPAEIRPRRDALVAGYPCLAGWPAHFDREGRLSSARLAADHDVLGTRCAANTTFVIENGRLQRFTPVLAIEIDGFRFAGGHEVTRGSAYLDFLWGTLEGPREIGGVPCAAAPVQLDERRAVVRATLSRAATIDGRQFDAGAIYDRSRLG